MAGWYLRFQVSWLASWRRGPYTDINLDAESGMEDTTAEPHQSRSNTCGNFYLIAVEGKN